MMAFIYCTAAKVYYSAVVSYRGLSKIGQTKVYYSAVVSYRGLSKIGQTKVYYSAVVSYRGLSKIGQKKAAVKDVALPFLVAPTTQLRHSEEQSVLSFCQISTHQNPTRH